MCSTVFAAFTKKFCQHLRVKLVGVRNVKPYCTCFFIQQPASPLKSSRSDNSFQLAADQDTPSAQKNFARALPQIWWGGSPGMLFSSRTTALCFPLEVPPAQSIQTIFARALPLSSLTTSQSSSTGTGKDHHRHHRDRNTSLVLPHCN